MICPGEKMISLDSVVKIILIHYYYGHANYNIATYDVIVRKKYF
jgi:hypothetical protein